jgi:hypothetical protein
MKKAILLACLIAGGAAFFASTHPDGLDKFSEIAGFSSRASEHISIMSGYSLPWISGPASTALAGITGVLFITAFFFGLRKLLSR